MNDIPDDCSDPTIGRKFWALHANPAAVEDERYSLMLLRHPMSCPACLERVLNLFHREQAANRAAPRDDG